MNCSKKPKDKRIVVLGSTGSVGRQTLDVAARTGAEVIALSASSNIGLLEDQIRQFHPHLCAVRDSEAAKQLRIAVSDTDTVVIDGENAASEVASLPEADMVFNSTSGFAGLFPTLAAIAAGHDVALANKETLVAAGEIVMNSARERRVHILPVDSEHCAVFQCLQTRAAEERELRSVILTASGGPFRGYTREMLSRVTREQALRHPTWKMGPKITVDCATLMNKGLEVIEAARLYDLDADRVRVVVHPESIIHSMVEYTDNAVLAQLAVPDMRSCISYALHYPHRGDAVIERLDLTSVGSLSFFKPDTETFSLLALAYDALRVGGTMPAILNAANECVVGHFLRGEVGSFTDIFDLVGETVAEFSSSPNPSIDDVISADHEARRAVERRLSL